MPVCISYIHIHIYLITLIGINNWVFCCLTLQKVIKDLTNLLLIISGIELRLFYLTQSL